MKTLSLLILLVGFIASCTQAQTTDKSLVFGKPFREKEVIPADKLPTILGTKDSLAVEVVGQVEAVCQAKGCWMDVKLADNTTMKVRFKDYAFFVPKDLKGKTVVLKGMAYNQTLSVEDQRHYAVDAGQPAEKVAAITQPKQTVTFTASGVKLK